ncbi:predicted protein [Sclerotinia sclerotiorum 1980 UF-70]|uniref:Uncharacterized protein n=1 Tax=Sclerotinia sclerotiorum (strain ATCC 18683 / 1980 / Ss-1) TaxID=665079 RepID=A7EIP1_SCLS1|nr:predicted protein [Sclerotinia sclerotiorum 1980 UF-70]EDO02707.1 predicted protein [Sclerotinia sclerotiorum 1980 UF-70]
MSSESIAIEKLKKDGRDFTHRVTSRIIMKPACVIVHTGYVK